MTCVISGEGIGFDRGADGERAGFGRAEGGGSFGLAPSRQVDRLRLACPFGIDGEAGADGIGREIADAGEQCEFLAGDRLGRLRNQAGDRHVGRAGSGDALGVDGDVGWQRGIEFAPGARLEIREDDQLAVAAGFGELAQGQVERGIERACLGVGFGLFEQVCQEGCVRAGLGENGIRHGIDPDQIGKVRPGFFKEAGGLGAGGIEAAANALAGGHRGRAVDQQDHSGLRAGWCGGFGNQHWCREGRGEGQQSEGAQDKQEPVLWTADAGGPPHHAAQEVEVGKAIDRRPRARQQVDQHGQPGERKQA